MKFLLIPIAAALLLSSCSYKISRQGYSAPTATVSDCDVTITYGPPSSIQDDAQLVGSITLDDGGFTSNCSESDAMLILKQDACALNANTILITEFKTPSLASTCYRCAANFYKVVPAHIAPDSIPVNKNIHYAKEYVHSKEPSAMASIAGYAAGFIIGFVLVSLLF